MKKALAIILALVMMLGMANMVFAEETGPFGSVPLQLDEGENPLAFEKYETPVTVTFARNGGTDVKFPEGMSYEENVYFYEYLEMLGIKVDTVWTTEGVEAYDMQLNMRINDNDLPDIFVCNAAQFAALVEADLIEDLTDVLEMYQSNMVKENFQADGGEGLSQATVDGKLYGLPSASVAAGKFHFFFIREDWRLALDLPVPRTLADIEAMARAFTFDDPDGNGIDDTYGMGFSNQPFETYFATAGWFNAFGAFPEQWIMKDGKIEHGAIQPEVKTALTAFRGWVEEGIIDPEFVVKGSGPVSEDAVNGKIGIASAEWWLISWPLGDAFKNGYDFRCYPIVFDDEAPTKQVGAVATLANRLVVRKGYEHPEVLVKMYNHFQERVMSQKYDINVYKGYDPYSFEGMAATYGVIGKDRNMRNHVIVTAAMDLRDPSILENNDQIKAYDDAINFLENMHKLESNLQTEAWGGYSTFIGPDSIYGHMKMYTQKDMINVDPFYGVSTPAMKDHLLNLKMATEVMIVEIMSGDKPIDYFDEFVNEWLQAGGEKMTAEANEWYQAQQ